MSESLTKSLQAAIDALPEHCQRGVRDYIVHGEAIGSFLRAVFENKLHAAFNYADSHNSAAMREYAVMLHHAPIECWGSAAKVVAWQGRGGLLGPPKKA